MKIKCACCDLPAAKITDGVLVLYQRHNGEKHYTPLTVAHLERILVMMRTAVLTEDGDEATGSVSMRRVLDSS